MITLPEKFNYLIMHPELEVAIDTLLNTDDNLCIVGEAGCLTGDTEIRLSRAKNGFRLPLKKLYERFNGIGTYRWDASFATYVRSYDEQEKRVKLNQVVDVVESGVKPIFELILTNGITLRGTYDHKIMTINGWKELGSLCSDDVILVDTTTKWSKTGKRGEVARKAAKKRNCDTKVRIGSFYPNKRVCGYRKNRVPIFAGTVHILEYEAFLNKVDVYTIIDASYSEKEAGQFSYVNTKTHVVHHKDGVHSNNKISNLELMTHRDHTMLHSNGSEINFKHGVPSEVCVREVRDLNTQEMTYDIKCKAPHHSFVANNIIVHNSGKSEFIKLCSDKSFYKKNTVVVTPTGISAVNASSEGVRATTIHSLFRLPPLGIIPPDKLTTHGDIAPIFRNLDILIIDEISMVNVDLLSKIVYLLKSYRNGTLPRIIVIGDPSQLAPIVKTPEEQEYIQDMYGSRYFFHAYIFDTMKILQFNRVFRQRDEEFSSVLSRFRYKRETDEDRKYLNSRVMPVDEFRKGGDFVHIALTNRVVNDINNEEMSRNPNTERVYYGRINNFGNALPVEERLVLKVDAQVMICVNNKTQGYYNGLLGRITKLNPETVEVSTASGSFTIEPFTWEKYTYKYEKEKKEIKAGVTGSFRQLPLKIAYALTSHKCQGLTLDRVYLDLEQGTFSSGQCYTACSRVRTIEGFGLKRAIKATDNRISMVVRRFYKKYGIGVENERRD